MRMRSANPEIARARCLSSTTPAPLPKSDATSVSETTFVANSIEDPSVERLYSDWIDSFEDKMSERGHSFGARLSERWSPLMLSLTSRPIADESGWYRVCTLCPGRKRVNSDHFLHDLEHCKRLKTKHNVERHKWDPRHCRWIDVPADATEEVSSSE